MAVLFYVVIEIIIMSLNNIYWELTRYAVLVLYTYSTHPPWNRYHIIAPYRWANQDIERSNNMVKVTQWVVSLDLIIGHGTFLSQFRGGAHSNGNQEGLLEKPTFTNPMLLKDLNCTLNISFDTVVAPGATDETCHLDPQPARGTRWIAFILKLQLLGFFLRTQNLTLSIHTWTSAGWDPGWASDLEI